MKIEPASTWIGGVIAIAVGVFIACCGVFIAVVEKRGPLLVTFLTTGVALVCVGAGQLGAAPLRRRDKPLDKPTASRHLAGPGRIWRPR